MNILVLYSSLAAKDRKTIRDSLYCFSRYLPQHKFYYLPVQKPGDLSPLIQRAPFDGVILHYTLLSRRFNPDAWVAFYRELKPRLAAMQGAKVAMPQDEYSRTAALWELVRECGVAHVFTLARPALHAAYYPPEKTGGATCSTVHPGYVDENSLAEIARREARLPARDIDVGYRARRLSYALGRHGQVKAELERQLQKARRGHPGLRMDISATGNRKNALLEGRWYDFLLRCRVMPGCVGGASLMDADGSVEQRVAAYVAAHPDAGFEETQAACFAGMDYNATYYCLGPRHFECAMTKTCQVLVEGDYFGVFEPGVHYIELKADYSNLNEVLEKIQDKAYCEQLAQRCYDDVVAAPGPENPNTYAWFAAHVASRIAQLAKARPPGRFPHARCAAHCGLVRARTRLSLRVYNRAVIMYNGLSRFLASRPRARGLAQKLFRRPFWPLDD